MKKLVCLSLMLFALVHLLDAQAQKEISFNVDDGFKIEALTSLEPIVVNFQKVAPENLPSSLKSLQKMEDEFVRVIIDEKSQKATIKLVTDKQPTWTTREWTAYLNRRSLLVQ